MNVCKQIILMLSVCCIALPVAAMDSAPEQYIWKRQPKSLVSLSIAQLEEDIKQNVIPQQCALLAQTISATFPMSQDRYSFSKQEALEKLIEITKVVQENELIRITPVSIEIKNVPPDVLAKFSTLFLELRVDQIFLTLYEICPIFKICIDKVEAEYVSVQDWQKHMRVMGAHPGLIRILEFRQNRKYDEIAERWNRMPRPPGARINLDMW